MKKNGTKRILMTLLMVCLTVLGLPTAAFAADANNDGYHDGDVAAVRAIINANPTLQAEVNADAPSTWEDKGFVGGVRIR